MSTIASTEIATVQPAQPAVSVDVDTLKYLGYNPQSVATRALVALAQRYQLDPLLGEIQLITDRQGPRLYISRDGMLAIAHRSGQLDGIIVDEQRRNSTDNGWTVYVSVYRKDMTHPFRYGAQCKDTEPQAKAGNGIEMALARAERRALKRAFQVRADFYPEQPQLHVSDDELEIDGIVTGPIAAAIPAAVDGEPFVARQEAEPDAVVATTTERPAESHTEPSGAFLDAHDIGTEFNLTAGATLARLRTTAIELGVDPPTSLDTVPAEVVKQFRSRMRNAA